MKKFTTLLTLSVTAFSVLFAAEVKKDMPSLQSFATFEQLSQRLRSTGGIKRFPPATDRKAWDKMYHGDLQQKYTYAILNEAPQILNTPWPGCSLKLLTQFIKKGDRESYMKPYNERRRRLTVLTFAECMENRGRYIEEIAEGLWQIISEPTWVQPAHERFNAPDPVPVDGKYEVVDLNASKTALLLGAVMELIEPQLLAYSPSLIDRVKKEIIRRVVVPLEAEGDEPWWLQKEIRYPSNWIPWCCANSLGAAAYVLQDDPDRLARLIWKMFAAVDKFIAVYMPDGACDEGPAYWRHSVAQMYQFMDHVNRRTDGLYNDFFKQPKIRRMGEFFADLNLTGNYFMNYADAQAQFKSVDYGMLYSFGESIKSDIMKSFCLKFAEENKNEAPACSELLPLLNLFRLPFKVDMSSYKHGEFAFFRDRQLFIARENAKDTSKGFIVSIKGGHNNEGHNHNDLGHFSIFCNGKPLIVDVGAGTYTRKTFSPERYTIWWIGGMGHNAAAVNGHIQLEGKMYHAKVRQVNTTGKNHSISLDLSAILPAEAGVKKYDRTLELNREKSFVSVADTIAVKKGTANVEIKLYSPQKAVSFSKNQVKWADAVMDLENISCVSIQEVDLKDEKKLAGTWNKLYCITLKTELKNSGSYRLKFIQNK